MPKRREFTPQEQQKLRELRAAKAPLWKLLATFECSPATVNTEIKRLGIPLRRAIDKRTFADLWERGVELEQICEELGISTEYAWSLRRKLELKPRPRIPLHVQIAALKATIERQAAQLAALQTPCPQGQKREVERTQEARKARREATEVPRRVA